MKFGKIKPQKGTDGTRAFTERRREVSADYTDYAEQKQKAESKRQAPGNDFAPWLEPCS
jgi:hypothetical protein